VSFQHTGPESDPGAARRSASEQWGPWSTDGSGEDTQPRPAVSEPSAAPRPDEAAQSLDAQFAIREHVTGQLTVHPADAPLFRPAYNPYAQLPPPQGPGAAPGQPYPPYAGGASPRPYYPPPPPAYNGYGYGYPYGYPYYGWQPRPKRDRYQFTVSIITTVGAGLALLGGLASALILILVLVLPHATESNSSLLSSEMTALAFAIAGLVGGAFCLYHSIRALNLKPSASVWLPWFWIPLILYLFVIGIGYALQVHGLSVTYPLLTIFLIVLAAVFPALALAALGVRRLRFPAWPTTWRRFTLALVSGATLGIGLALVLELGLSILALRSSGNIFFNCINDPTGPGCTQALQFNIVFLIIAVIGPVVEETVKPLGVALYSGRMRSAAEAFTLGMAAGVGFALVETVGYIGSGYQDWLTVALERTGASLLHGLGAGMVALGWYYLSHRKQGGGILIAILCWLYAVFQHFLWNGTAVLSLLPAPYGPTINSWSINLGFTSLAFLDAINIIEAILMLAFFIYMTGRLRRQTPKPSPAPGNGHGPKPSDEPRAIARV